MLCSIDILPNSWIENTDIPVQNLEILEHSAVTAQEVFEETISSPDVNAFSAVDFEGEGKTWYFCSNGVDSLLFCIIFLC